jgi:hypothetical protein
MHALEVRVSVSDNGAEAAPLMLVCACGYVCWGAADAVGVDVGLPTGG